MKQTDDHQFAAIVTALAVATGGDPDTPTIDLYFRALLDVPIDLLQAAAIELAKSTMWFPKPAQWRRAVDDLLDSRARVKHRSAGAPLHLTGEVAAAADRCSSCDDTGWILEDIPCNRFGHCVQFKEGTTHTHVWTHRCDKCQAKRRKLAEASKRYARRADSSTAGEDRA